ncbi:hypothetical protein [Brevibacillus formosus]|uniref:hypothetical protein n=1 Tax=Brevibacillus formosus TaxID=54913 RepID=UPI003F19996C
MKRWVSVITLSAFLLAIGSTCTTKESTHSSMAGDTIKLYRIVGFQPDKDKEIALIADYKQTEIPEGEYLLFLYGGYDEEVGHVSKCPQSVI